MFSAIKRGLGLSWRYKKILIVMYLLVLVLAAGVAYPLKTLLEGTVGHSLILADMIKGFDYTFLNDFNNTYGVGFVPIINQSIVTIGLFLLLFVFLTGGLVATFVQQPEKYDKSLFWGQNAYFFGRMLRMSFVFWILHGVVFLLIWSIFYNCASGFSPFDLESEETVSSSFKVIAPIYIFVAAFFFLWQDYAKIILVKTNQKWIVRALWQSLKYVLQNFGKTYGLYMLNFLFWIGLMVLNYKISSIEINSSQTIWIGFLLSQLFVISRFFLKLLLIGSLVELQKAEQ